MLRPMASFDPTSIVRLHGLNTLPKSSDRLHFLIVNHPWPLVDYDSRFSIVLLLFQRYLINSTFFASFSICAWGRRYSFGRDDYFSGWSRS